MSLFEIICLSAAALGAVLIMGAAGYFLTQKFVDRYKSSQAIEDEVSRYWQAIYATAARADRKALQKSRRNQN